MSDLITLFEQFYEIIDENTVKDKQTGEIIKR